MIRLEEILDKVEKHHPGDKLDLIRRAYIFSAKEHKGQVRASGEPYLTHPLEVANLLAEMKMDAVTVGVGLLHDVVEDTLTTLDKIEELFGPEVAHIVDGVTKISQVQFTSKEEKQAENFRKMLLAMTDDIRVIMVKFADRLHNMRTLAYLPAERRQAIARETLEIYAPLANRLGMGKIRGELEDLAFSYLDAKAYQELKDLVEKNRRKHEAFLAEVTRIVHEKMHEHGIQCLTVSHSKSRYQIDLQLKKQRIYIDDREDQRVSWLRHLVELQQEMKDPADFLSTLKIDLYPEEVYTFTPKGKVITLPRDASPVDFAYAIHTEVGHTCVGSKINGRMTPLRSKLRNGDIVEIITQPGHKPSRDWLSFVNTSRARNKIRHWLTEQESEKAIELGRKMVEKEARKYKQSVKELLEGGKLDAILPEYGSSKVEDLLSAIGYGKVSAKQIIARLVPDGVKEAVPEEESRITSVVKRVFGLGTDAKLQVKGFDDLLVYRAKCCNPIRGEEVIGYITRGKGVAVHSKNCPNVQNLLYDADRKVDVVWAGAAPAAESYAVPLTIVTEDRPGMLAEIAAAISDVKANILNVEARTADERGTIDITVEIPDLKHLERVITSIKKIDGVYDVSRSTKTLNIAR